jgi:hypothetical protein
LTVPELMTGFEHPAAVHQRSANLGIMPAWPVKPLVQPLLFVPAP